MHIRWRWIAADQEWSVTVWIGHNLFQSRRCIGEGDWTWVVEQIAKEYTTRTWSLENRSGEWWVVWKTTREFKRVTP